MARERRYMNRVNGWEQTATGVEGRSDEVPHLVQAGEKLEELIQRARSLSSQQATLTASKQETTKTLRRVIQAGDALADFLRTGARAHYGSGSEILIEFGVQPFRARPRTTPTEPLPPVPEAPAPESSAPDSTK